MTALRPGVRIEKIEARKTAIRQPGENVCRVAVVKPDIRELFLLNQRQRFRHAVDEGFDADETDTRILPGFGDEMLAAAETAFETNVIDSVEKRAQVGRRHGEIKRKARQQRLHQIRLMQPQLLALAPSEKGARPFSVITEPPRSGVTR